MRFPATRKRIPKDVPRAVVFSTIPPVLLRAMFDLLLVTAQEARDGSGRAADPVGSVRRAAESCSPSPGPRTLARRGGHLMDGAHATHSGLQRATAGTRSPSSLDDRST